MSRCDSKSISNAHGTSGEGRFVELLQLFADVQGFPGATEAGEFAGLILTRVEAAATVVAVAPAVQVTDIFRVCLRAASWSSAPPSIARAATPAVSHFPITT
jgi:hypothetical protein